MAKFVADGVLDAAIAKADDVTTVHVCSSQPANHAAIAAASLADVTVTAGTGNGDFSIGDGDTSGRKLTLAAQSGVTIDASGTATHIVGTDGTTLLWVTTCTSQDLVANGSNTVDIPSFDIEFADAS